MNILLLIFIIINHVLIICIKVQIQAIFPNLHNSFFHSIPIEMAPDMLTSEKVLISVPLNNGIFLVFSAWQKMFGSKY